MDYDVIVIGAGYGGLSIGALMAKRGRSVLIFEQSRALGGRARSDAKDGYTLDYGWHVNRFGEDGAAAAVLRRLGEEIEWAGEGASLVHFEGRLHPRPSSVTGFLTTGMLPLADRLRLLLALLRALRARPADWYERSWAQFVRQTTDSSAVLKLCKLFSYGIFAPDPETASAGEVIYFIQCARKAREVTAMPVGGTKQIVDKLAGAIREAGGQVRTEARVEHILVEDGRAVGVRAGGQTYLAGTVVFTPPVQQLFRVLADEFLPGEFWEYAANLEPTAAISLDFGLRERIVEGVGSVVDLDGPMAMGAFPSNLDPGLAPEGKQLATFLVSLSPEEVEDEETVEAATRKLKDWIETLYPGFFEQVEWERRLVLPVVDGVHLKVGQAYLDRHAIASPHIRGLFFVGDTVKAEGCSSDIAFAAALEAEELIEGYLSAETTL